MSPPSRLRHRVKTVLTMVMAFVVIILLGQLWLFNVALDVVQLPEGSATVVASAVLFSLIGCVLVWVLIGFFLKTEKKS